MWRQAKIMKGGLWQLLIPQDFTVMGNIISASLTISFTAAGKLSAGKSGSPRDDDSGDRNE